MHKSEFGVIGLGVMGKSISLNIAENGFSTSVYNRICESEKNVVDDFMNNTSFKNINGFRDLKSFVDAIERPRRILIMIKAGTAIDTIIQQILPFLNKGDVILMEVTHYLQIPKEEQFIYINRKLILLDVEFLVGKKVLEKAHLLCLVELLKPIKKLHLF